MNENDFYCGYSDIIDLPRHVSEKHKPMPALARAAQFSPFAALTGYEEAVEETARLTGARPVLTEDESYALDESCREIREILLERGQADISVVYFLPDSRKKGGSLVSFRGVLRAIDEYDRIMIFTDGRRIPMTDVYRMKLCRE